jgi:hypothetical protein
MAKTQLKLEQFLHGQEWAATYARRSLPILVRFVEQHRGRPDSEIPVFTYASLAIAVGQPKHAHPIMAALGTLGFALKELSGEHMPGLGEIPPIQLLVWSQGKGSPANSHLGLLENPRRRYMNFQLGSVTRWHSLNELKFWNTQCGGMFWQSLGSSR